MDDRDHQGKMTANFNERSNSKESGGKHAEKVQKENGLERGQGKRKWGTTELGQGNGTTAGRKLPAGKWKMKRAQGEGTSTKRERKKKRCERG